MSLTFEATQTQLLGALTEVVRVFGDAPGSPHWTDPLDCRPEGSSITLESSCFELTQADYQDFCWHSVVLFGHQRELSKRARKVVTKAIRYFLPRLLDDYSDQTYLASRKDLARRAEPSKCPPLDREHLSTIMQHIGWQQWPAAEQAALNRWLLALMAHRAIRLRRDLAETTTFGLRCGFDVGGALKELLRIDRTVGAYATAILLNHDSASALTDGWPSGWQKYWGDEGHVDALVARQYLSALVSQTAQAALQDAFFSAKVDDTRTCLSTAISAAEHCMQFGHLHPGTPLAEAVAHKT